VEAVLGLMVAATAAAATDYVGRRSFLRHNSQHSRSAKSKQE
jgi:hypothetical protein